MFAKELVEWGSKICHYRDSIMLYCLAVLAIHGVERPMEVGASEFIGVDPRSWEILGLAGAADASWIRVIFQFRTCYNIRCTFLQT